MQKLKLITEILNKLTRLIAKFNHNQYAASDISDLVNVDISTTAMHLHSLGLIEETKEAIANLKTTYEKNSTKERDKGDAFKSFQAWKRSMSMTSQPLD